MASRVVADRCQCATAAEADDLRVYVHILLHKQARVLSNRRLQQLCSRLRLRHVHMRRWNCLATQTWPPAKPGRGQQGLPCPALGITRATRASTHRSALISSPTQAAAGLCAHIPRPPAAPVSILTAPDAQHQPASPAGCHLGARHPAQPCLRSRYPLPACLLLGGQVCAPAAKVGDVLGADHRVALAQEALDRGVVLEQHVAQAQRGLDAVAEEVPAAATGRARLGCCCCCGAVVGRLLGGPDRAACPTRLSRWGSPTARARCWRPWWSPRAA